MNNASVYAAFERRFIEHSVPVLQSRAEYAALKVALGDWGFHHAHDYVWQHAITLGVRRLSEAQCERLEEKIAIRLSERVMAIDHTIDRINRTLADNDHCLAALERSILKLPRRPACANDNSPASAQQVRS